MDKQRLIVSDITSSYKNKQVLKGISLSADKGQCVGIVGSNGCGKSTLLNILAGLRKPDSGTVFFDGQEAKGIKRRQLFIQYTGYVPQENNLIPELNVLDNLLLWYEDKQKLQKELEEGFLKELDLNSMCKLKVSKLSGGMKKKVSIGCALAGNPPVLLLDEPDAALDIVGKNQIRQYLISYKESGGTIILATHEENDLSICDKVYAVNGGKSTEIDKNLRGENLLRAVDIY